MPTCKPLRQWLGSVDWLRQIVVDAGYGWNEPTRTAETILRAGGATTARALAERLDAGGDEAYRGGWLAAAAAADRAIDERAGRRRTVRAGCPAGTRRRLRRRRPGLHGLLDADSRPGGLRSGRPAEVRFLANRGANGIDGLVSSGIGAAIASGRPAWILTGDLGAVPRPQRAGRSGPRRGAGASGRLRQRRRRHLRVPAAGRPGRPRRVRGSVRHPDGPGMRARSALWGLYFRRVERADEVGASPAGSELVEVPVDRRRGVELRGELCARRRTPPRGLSSG